MKVDFSNIDKHIIPMADFPLKWRFLDDGHHYYDTHFSLLQPLDKVASDFLWNYISQSGLHDDTPFKRSFFKTVDRIKMSEQNEDAIRKWLYRRSFSFDKKVYLSWQPEIAMVVPYKLVIKYHNTLFFSSSDDLTVIDQSMTWALLFYHDEEIYFGTNHKFMPDQNFADKDFSKLA